jgi:hypothetical protein
VTRTAWRVIWEEGIDLEGTWVPLALLQRLNTVHGYFGPLRAAGQHLDLSLGRLLVLHGLAREATRSGYLGGARLRPFLDALERAPCPELPGGSHEPA